MPIIREQGYDYGLTEDGNHYIRKISRGHRIFETNTVFMYVRKINATMQKLMFIFLV